MIAIKFPKDLDLRDRLHEAIAGWEPYIDSGVIVSEGEIGVSDCTLLMVGPSNGHDVVIDITGYTRR